MDTEEAQEVETLDGSVVADTDGQYERPTEVKPDGKAPARAEPVETIESLREERDRRAREADATRSQQRQIMVELRQLRAWQENQRTQAQAEYDRIQQAQAQARRQEAYADAPDYVLDLADQIQATQNLVLTAEQRRQQEEFQAATQEQQLRQTGNLMERFVGELKSEADPELGFAMAYETQRAINEIHWTASLMGERLTPEEAMQLFSEQLVTSMHQTAGMNAQQRAQFFKDMASMRGWRPELPVTAKPPNGTPGKSPAQLAQEQAAARQNRQRPLSGPSATGANGASEVDFATMSSDDYIQARLEGKISQRQAEAYEATLISGT